jgi:predicted PurR-regulated permease PerM
MPAQSNDDPRAAVMPELGSPGGMSGRERAVRIVAFGVVLMLLYFGRNVLVPLTLAVLLSLLLAPLVQLLRRVGLGQTLSVLAAVVALACAVSVIAIVLGSQVLRIAESLPQYEQTIEQKLQNLDALTLGRLNALTGEVQRLIEKHSQASAARQSLPTPQLGSLSPALTPVPVEVREPAPDPFQLIGRALVSVWLPIQTAGIVLFVLVFVLLERETLRDRVIRLAGANNIRLMTLALNDAGERLSRFFVSQFAVNLGVGAALGLGLALLGLPHAVMWGSLAAIMRFVPYIGVWVAAVFAIVLAIAVVPGWSLALETLTVFILVEVIAAQLVEPNLYGHATGLSPLSVVVAAIFWTSIWGPMGLILSTPLTLCLVVVGRHIPALGFLDLILGDTEALTLPQKFYQRALSGDAHEIIANAQQFLRSNSLADYCDRVVMPALHLALLDYQMGAISEEQQAYIRDVIVKVVASISGDDMRHLRRRRQHSVLEHANPGRMLRLYREQVAGKWQGPIAVPPGSVTVCLSLGAPGDDLATELLVRILRDQKLDARHFSVADAEHGPPPNSAPGAVAVVFLVSALPNAERERSHTVEERVRGRLPNALVLRLFLPGLSLSPQAAVAQVGPAERVVTSFGEAVQICLERRQSPPARRSA